MAELSSRVQEAQADGLVFNTHNHTPKWEAKSEFQALNNSPHSTPNSLLGLENLGDLDSELILATSDVQKVCIIGGGVAGVATARVFLNEGLQCDIFEKTGKLGGVWADNYTGFGIQVPSALYEFPDDPLPRGWDFAAGEMINKYINNYAEKHGVTKIARFNTEVTGLVRMGGIGAKYEVKVRPEGGEEEVLHYDLVIICTGVYSSTDKFIPDYPGKERFQGTWLHSVDLKDIRTCTGKDVITVGAGKSAFDCAQFSAKVGKSSTLLYRTAHWPVPRKILGLVPFQWATFSRFGAGVLMPMYPKAGPLERICAKIPGFLSGFWWLVSKIFAWQFELGDLTPKIGFIEDFWGGHGVIPHPDFFPLIKCGLIGTEHGTISEVKEKSVMVKTASGEVKEMPADVLLFGTGFKKSLSFCPDGLREKEEEDGLWLYRNMVHPDYPNLIFVNSNTSTFTNITTASLQARWVCELLTGRMQKPSHEQMVKEIQIQKNWKRAHMPQAGKARAYMMQTHQLHYFDELLKDMGASVRRKSTWPLGFLAEIFAPYAPADYGTIVTGVFRTIPDECAEMGANQPAFWRETGKLLLFFVFLYFISSIFMTGLTITVFGADAAQASIPIPEL